ncbi:hypothetical protein [Escherichia coli]|uniref:hypothetical protein n=1 Tax=Escherichia coli TaxID=562 RepID=UPI001A4169B4|nr:hypothetical protein [Escherichia coli]VVY10189.1 Uncharacterised protein [Escherichia coli]
MFEQDLELFKSYIEYLITLEKELTTKYKGIRVLCWYDDSDYKRELTIDRIYFIDGVLNVHGVNDFGHSYTYSNNAKFKRIDNE